MVGALKVNSEQVDIIIFLTIFVRVFFSRMGGRWGEGQYCLHVIAFYFLFRWRDCMIVVYFL